MPTGDGLLARLPQAGPLAPAAFAAFCRAARDCGNGLVEVTARGSLQARGFTPVSARAFAEACRAAGIADRPGPPVHASPLGRMGPGSLVDMDALVASLRGTVAAFTGRVAAKVAIVVDDGGALHLDTLAADIRLRAVSAGRFLIGVAGDGRSVRWLGTADEADAVAAACALLEAIARLGVVARARDLTQPARIVTRWIAPAPPAAGRPAASFIGAHRLADGRLAAGIGLAFGQTEAEALEALSIAAGGAGASGLVPAPEHALLVLGLRAECAAAFIGTAARLGFITRADDLRRNVVACAGAPACAAALMPARAMAEEIARAAQPILARGGRVHLSGCAKGCASRDRAVLTVVGTPAGCAVVRDGHVGDVPEDIVPAGRLAAHVARLAVREPA
jgi:precorrin-3B synthase